MSVSAKSRAWLAGGVILLAAAAAWGESYAVLFSGGIKKADNNPWYYGQAHRLRQQLVDTLYFAPENIYILCSDGMNTAGDMSDGRNSYWGDAAMAGSTVLSATPGNLQNTLASLPATQADLLLLWTFDHGGGTYNAPGTVGEELLYGWGVGNAIADDALASWVGGMEAGREAFVFGQCYSGGMLDDLNIAAGQNRFGCASANHYEKSWRAGFLLPFNDAIQIEGLTTTHAIYQHAYLNDVYATDGEGPGGACQQNVEHPWKVGDDLDLLVGRWTGASSDRWADAANWDPQPTPGRTVRVELGPSEALVVDTPTCQGGYLSVDWPSGGGYDSSSLALHTGAHLQAAAEVFGDRRIGRAIHWTGDNTVAGEIILGKQAGAHGLYELWDGAVSAGTMHVGYAGAGRFVHTGGTHNVSAALCVASQPTGTGSYFLHGGATLSAGSLGYVSVGTRGQGRFIHDGGSSGGNTLIVGHEPGATGTYELSGGGVSMAYEQIGRYGKGTFIHTGGTNRAAYTLYMGWAAGSEGGYELSGGQLTAGDEFLGYGYGGGAVATFTHTGGTNEASGRLFLGSGYGVTARYDLSGTGTVLTDQEYIGDSGTGIFVQSGGVHSITSTLQMGRLTSGAGRYELQGGQLSVGMVIVGGEGTGSVIQTGGTHATALVLRLAETSVGDGTYVLGGSGLLSAGREVVGYAGAGTFKQSAGDNAVTGTLCLGYDAGSSGRYELSGGQVTASEVHVGHFGDGTVVHTGGRLEINGDLYLGCDPGSSGRYELSGTGELQAENEYIGGGGSGWFIQSGGSNRVSGAIYIGVRELTDADFEIRGGSLVAGGLYVGKDGHGQATQSDGSVSVEGSLVIGSGTGASGVYTYMGGDLSARTIIIGGDGQGRFELACPQDVLVSGTLRLGADSSLSVQTGGCVRMTGADFENQSTSPANLLELANLTLIFEGGPAVTDDVEVAGQNRGLMSSGWVQNFALGALQLGGSAAGRIRLLDDCDNQQDGPGNEALYVDGLTLNAGATVDLNGLRLYYLNGAGPKEFYHGDATLDGAVDVFDLALLGNNYLASDRAWADGDFNGDGVVDVFDLAILGNNYLKGPPSGESLPEPATILILTAAGLPMLLKRRRNA